MSGHRPFSELTKDFSQERRRLNAIGSNRLGIKVEIARIIGEELLLKNDDLSDLLCEAELDFSDKELLNAIQQQIEAVAGTAQEFNSEQLRRLAELTDEIRGWITLAESVKV